MDSKEILLTAKLLSDQKEIPQEEVFKDLETAISTALRRRFVKGCVINVSIDRTTGEWSAQREWSVVDDNFEEFDSAKHLYEDQAQEKGDFSIGDTVSEDTDATMSRSELVIAKQVLKTQLRASGAAQTAAKYQNNIGELVQVVARKFRNGNQMVDAFGEGDGIIPKGEKTSRDRFKEGQRILAVLKDVNPESHQPLIFSRADSMFVEALFNQEVPEIANDIVKIHKIVRRPGQATKVAVYSKMPDGDPVRYCVGIKGFRIQTIIQEMGGEQVDLIRYDDDLAQFVINAFGNIEPVSLVIDEDTNVINVAVKDGQLSMAIGSGGSNIRLISELIGWTVNVMSVEDFDQLQNDEFSRNSEILIDALGADEDLVNILIEEGFLEVEMIAYSDVEDLAEIDGFDHDLAESLIERAAEAIKNAKEDLPLFEKLNQIIPEITILQTLTLINNDIDNLDDFAELATDELCDIITINKEVAAESILKARETLGWFEEA